MGWRIVAEYQDRESGAKGEKDRMQFKAMMDPASRREFGTVLVWSLDQFSREGHRQDIRSLASPGLLRGEVSLLERELR
jgi:DNA invertase Pin-like site-specific DNA recombinase